MTYHNTLPERNAITAAALTKVSNSMAALPSKALRQKRVLARIFSAYRIGTYHRFLYLKS